MTTEEDMFDYLQRYRQDLCANLIADLINQIILSGERSLNYFTADRRRSAKDGEAACLVLDRSDSTCYVSQLKVVF